MDLDLARQSVRMAFRISGELQDHLALLKQTCQADKYKQHALQVAAAVDAVNVALLNSAVAAHPALAREIDDRIATYGRYRP